MEIGFFLLLTKFIKVYTLWNVENENYFIFRDTKGDYKLLIMLLLDGESEIFKPLTRWKYSCLDSAKGREPSCRNVFYAAHIAASRGSTGKAWCADEGNNR